LEKGRPLVEAALEGARLRLRPILMTSFAFIFGCLPLWVADGAGAAARRMLGTTVVTGMLAATLLGIFFVPALFVFMERLGGRRLVCAELASLTFSRIGVQRALSGFLSAMQCIVSAGVSRSNSQEAAVVSFFQRPPGSSTGPAKRRVVRRKI